MLRVLQIGLGRFGQNHLQAWRKLGVDLRVADLDPAVLRGVVEPASPDWGTWEKITPAFLRSYPKRIFGLSMISTRR